MNNIVISPSGNFYGSEQVLFDYLRFSKLKCTVYIYGKDLLFQKLKEAEGGHALFYYNTVPLLYLKIAFLCLAGRVRSIYLNEAGHVKYVAVLSKLFPFVNFIVHVRILEDTVPDRLGRLAHRPNVSVISISKYVSRKILFPNKRIYDPFPFNQLKNDAPDRISPGCLIIGVIGRISLSKGMNHIFDLLDLIRSNDLDNEISVIFYGDVTPEIVRSERFARLTSLKNVTLKGFEPEKKEIYNSIDCVLHASEQEGLGRIFLEAIDFGKPIIGIDAGGIGELGDLLNIKTLLVKPDDAVAQRLLEKVLYLRDNYAEMVNEIKSRKRLAADMFSPERYAAAMDALIDQ